MSDSNRDPSWLTLKAIEHPQEVTLPPLPPGAVGVNVHTSHSHSGPFHPVDPRNIHPRRESTRLAPEVHVAGLLVDPRPEGILVLLARRSLDRELFPGRWEGCGGQLAPGETFAEGTRRHFSDEFGILVDPLENLHALYAIQRKGKLTIPGIRFLCLVTGDRREPHSENHSELRWILEKDAYLVNPRECVPRLLTDLFILLDQFRRNGFPVPKVTP